MTLKEYSADTGTPLADHTEHTLDMVTAIETSASTSGTFFHLYLTELAPSLTNPRKNFNPAKLTELADSIKASGVHQPILVRPLPGERVADTERNVAYEIVSGERRYRASLQAGVKTIPAIVRSMSDSQVLDAQIVENLQRDNLTPLEEAEGYERIQQHNSLGAREVAKRIGMSPSYVLARLKLLDLSHHCKEALRMGDIDASIALLCNYGSQAQRGYMDPEGVVVFHSASGTLFKKTIKDDHAPKSTV